MLGETVSNLSIIEVLHPLTHTTAPAVVVQLYLEDGLVKAQNVTLFAFKEQRGFRQTARLILGFLDQVCEERGWSTAFLDNFLGEIDQIPSV